MRAAEWINALVFSFLTALAWVRPLPAARRAKATGLGAAGLGVTLIGAWLLPGMLTALAASVARDWLPAALVLLVYWEAGAFFVRVDREFQAKLERLDRRLVAPVLLWLARSRSGRAIAAYLEFAYLFCYPMVPLGLGALYWLRMGRAADSFWTVVLTATYASYCMVPFIQTLPPRMIDEAGVAKPPATGVRESNLWILQHASIHANTFPSAHVAASIACALFLVRVNAAVGLVFLFVAISISLGAVLGRYHYAADAILGAAAAIAALLAELIYSGL
jgi:hypothetical protein